MSASTSKKLQEFDQGGSAFDVYEIQYDVKLAASIINTRLKLSLTQEELAEKLGTLQPAIARAESGDQPPSHKLLKKLARAFGARLIPPSFVLQEVHNFVPKGAIAVLKGEVFSSNPQKTTFNNAFRPTFIPCTQVNSELSSVNIII